MQKIADAPVKQCPECHKESVVRIVSPAGFQLKGTGWYVTDFKDKDKKKATPKKEATNSTASSENKAAESKSSTKKGEGD